MVSSKVFRMVELLIRDQDLGRQPSPTISLAIPSERISIREIIRSRVYQAVQDQNAKRRNASSAHQPSVVERDLNGAKRIKSIGWQFHFDQAVEAFDQGRLVILVDEHQAESLDEEVDVIHSQTLVTFLRLVPLVGG
jgi:vacuolar-type H+-ATPase subunit F/Vma7